MTASDSGDPPSPRERPFIRFWRTDVDADVRDEIAFHLEQLVAGQIAAGMSDVEARRFAEQRFGNTEEIGRAMRKLANQRETTMRRTAYLQDLGRDFRFAWRQLAKRPVFTIVAVVTLALGIGANTAIFSVVNSVLLRPLPVRNLDELVFVHTNMPTLPILDGQLDPPSAMELVDNPGVFQHVAGLVSSTPVLAGDGDPLRLTATQTIGRFFDVFGVKPVLGRFHRPDESTPGQHRVVVLSHDLWQQLGGSPSIVGTKLQFSSGTFEVIGVAPDGFRFPRTAQLWMPYQITPQSREARGRLMVTVVGRLKPDATPVALQAYLDNAGEKLNPGSKARNEFFYSSKGLVQGLAGELRPALLALLGAVGFVLLIACANVASLQLVHGAVRARELAVRAALGAGRGAIVRQLLVENLALSFLGGLLGLGMGLLILKLLALSGAAELPALARVRLDGRVLAFTAIATVLSGLLFGMPPAVRAGRADLLADLKESGGARSFRPSKNRLLHAGVIVQVALTLVLLLGSTLMVRTVSRLLEQDPGFRSEQVATVRIAAAGPKYAGDAARLALYDGVLDHVSQSAGVQRTGMVSELPFSGGTDSSPFTIEGMPEDPRGAARHANLLAVAGDYFRTMGVPLLRGRVFERTDIGTSEMVAVIDEQLAKQFFGSTDPIGQRITQGGPSATIVGVVGSVSQIALGEQPKAAVYYPLAQHPWYSSMYVVVRSALPIGPVTGIVREAVKAVDPGAPVFEPRLLVERVNASLASRRLTMTVLSGLSFVSLLLAVCGLYGVISYIVSQRATEIGIRVALGAQPRHVRGMIVRQGAVLASGGIVVGLVAAAVGTNALRALLYGVSPHDPASFGVAAALLALVALGASYLPAHRATRVDPLETLRRGG